MSKVIRVVHQYDNVCSYLTKGRAYTVRNAEFIDGKLHAGFITCDDGVKIFTSIGEPTAHLSDQLWTVLLPVHISTLEDGRFTVSYNGLTTYPYRFKEAAQSLAAKLGKMQATGPDGVECATHIIQAEIDYMEYYHFG